MNANRSSAAAKRRPGTLEEVAALVPTNAIDLLVAIWRAKATTCPTCGAHLVAGSPLEGNLPSGIQFGRSP